MENNYLLGIIGRLHGYHTRCKELHYSAASYGLHEIIGDFDDELGKFEDSIAENTIPLFGFIYPGEIKPILPKEIDIESLLLKIRGELVGMKRIYGEDMMMTGFINIVDDFFVTVNRYLTLILLELGKAQQ